MKIRFELMDKEIEGRIIDVKAVKFGNSAHITLPKEFLGKKGKLIMPFEEFEIDKEIDFSEK